MRIPAVLLTSCVVAAACTSSSSLAGDEPLPLVESGPATTEAAAPTTTADGAAPTTTAPVEQVWELDPGFDLDGRLRSTTSTEPVPSDANGGGDDGAVSSTNSPSPQTPSSGGGGPPPDVMSLYTGLLGTLAVDDVLATTTAPFPTVAAGTAPLTGLSPAPPSRPAVVVKIDNSGKARPQSGLNLADVVIEQEVEWGITRFAAVFHSTQVSTVGPVRSARSTDISFLSALGQPALVYSGANEVFDRLLLDQERVQNFSAARTGGYWRSSSRSAPSNLYTDTRNFDRSGAPPGAWFAYAPTGPSGGAPVASATVAFPNARIVWTWDGGAWLREQDGRAHTTDGGAQVSTANVVVAEVPVVDSGLVDSVGSIVPEFVWAGTGRVAVFSGGRRVDGTWTRPTLADPAVLVDDGGNVITLTPGSTWVELVRSLP